jgi:hypothetical protein
MKDHLQFAGKVLAVLIVYKIVKGAVADKLPATVAQYLP